MNKSILLALFIMCLISLQGQTNGVLTVSTTTSSTGGNYAPNNVLAIWIEDASGNFVKTLLAYADGRITHLNTWQASTSDAGSEFNVVDAITGATKSSHSTRICTWNGEDYNRNLMPDGTYTIKMELTDKNATGNVAAFTFLKGVDANSQTPANKSSFSANSIAWQPSTSGMEDKEVAENYRVYPNPTSGIISVSGKDVREISIYNLSGALICRSSDMSVDISREADGIFFVRLMTREGFITKKILKE